MAECRPHWQQCSAELRQARACRHTWRAVVECAHQRASITGRRYRVELGAGGWHVVDVEVPACI